MKLTILLAVIVAHLSLSWAEPTADFSVVGLKCEYLTNPLSVETRRPRLGWSFTAKDAAKQNLTQKAYQIVVSSDPQKLAKREGDLWDSGKVLSDANTHITYNGKTLVSEQTAYWTVRVWDQNDRPSDYSPTAQWSQGLQVEDWTAEWIGAPKDTQHKALQNLSDIDANVVKSRPALVPVLYFRKPFKAEGNVKSAKLYATAQGVYKVLINGQTFQDQVLSPGWTDYTKTLEYQSYDITKFVQHGDNVLVGLLSTGWNSGYIGFMGQYHHYGDQQFLLAELHIEYENGTKSVVKTDSTWRVNTGPLIYSDMLMGELYYEDRELTGYHTPSYDDKLWLSVVTKPIDKKIKLLAQTAQPVRVVETLKPKSKNEVKPGVWILDFEQNMVGWVELKFKPTTTPKSFRVQLRHAEVLNPDGNINVANLRAALATDTYVISDFTKLEDLNREPHFTYHGFRYLEITGYPGEPDLEDITGKVVHSDTPFVGNFETSNEMVNRVYLNTLWSQKANFFSIPTDCPQRDERMGWTADAEVFAPTAAYNADVSAFYTKWIRDMREAQSAQGGYPDVAPRKVVSDEGAPAWGDAGVIVPYVVYKMYGDTRVIEEHYDSMKKWIDYILSANPDLLWKQRVSNNFGDWMSVGADTPKDVLSTAYFAYDALLMSRMAAAINKTEDSLKYQSLHANISEAFNKAYVDQTSAKIKGDTQTVYLVGLAFELLPEKLRPLAAQHLADNVKAHDWHLTTGFVGVGYLNPILSQYGHNDVAYKVLLKETYPSWGYCVLHNATTIWEKWDDIKGDKPGIMGLGDTISFNPYSLGSVGRWLFQSVGGIDQTEQSVGFRHILIKPEPGTGLSFANTSYESVSGLITSSWTLSGDTFKLNTSIPVNTRATIDLTFSKSGAVHEVGSGVYEFEVKLN